MSEPVTKSEIEDVLSSIRRLVSEESRIEPRRAPPHEAAERGRLVLTPALRVAEPPRPESDPEIGPEIDRQADDDPDADLPGAAEEAFANDEDREWDDEAGEVDTDAHGDPDGAPWRDPEATLFATARAAEDAGPDASPQDDTRDPAGTADDDPDRDAAPAWEFEEGEDGGLDEADTDETDPGPADRADEDDLRADDADGEDLGKVDDYDDADRYDDDAFDDDAFDDDLSQDDEGIEHDGEAAVEDRVGDSRTATLGAKIQALEAAIGRTQDQWEPDGAGGDDYAGTRVETIAWEDHAEATEPPEAPAAKRASADSGRAEDAPDLFPSDEAFLDEESLRELVADIVREELQGALGERITRNVRKLVRREIHRALTAQELE